MADEQKTIVTKKASVRPAGTKKAAVKKAPVKDAAPKSAVARAAATAEAPRTTKKAVAKKAALAPAAPPATKPAPPASKTGAASRSASPGKQRTTTTMVVTGEERDAMIRERAYYKAEKRNFDPAFDAENWAQAEREVDELLSRR
jgi:hypothetical protein